MGKSRENDLIYAEIPICLSGYAHIRVLLEAVGLATEEGVVAFVPDITKKRQVVHMLERYGGVRKELHGNRMPEAYNYQMVLVEYQPFYKEESIQRFMKCRDFLPVLIVGGIIPEKLLSFKNVIVLEKINFNLAYSSYPQNVYKKIVGYIHLKSGKIISEIEKFQRQKYFSEDFELSSFQKCMVTVAMIFQKIKYDMDAKIITQEELQDILYTIYSVTEISIGNGSVTECVRKMLAKYVDEHTEICIGKCNELEGELLNAVKEKRGILYDDEFYYVPEELLRVITKPILESLSFSAIKNGLFEDETLVCDKTADCYTVKKCLVSAFGEILRQRFLKMDRNKLERESELTLIERSEVRCTSETMKGRGVMLQPTRPTSQL